MSSIASSSLTPDPVDPPSVPAPVADSVPKITRGHSCVLCQQRKVKCDRQKPCSNCVKARAECVVATPAQPRRRRKRLTESDLVLRLRRYEHLLKSHGVKVEVEDLHPQDYPRPSKEDEDAAVSDMSRLTMHVPKSNIEEPGALFFGRSHAHYIENTLWQTVKEEIEEQLDSSSEDEIYDPDVLPPGDALLMSFTSGPVNLAPLHPSIVQIFRLWQIFLDNVNPLVKMFHAPTIQQMLITAGGDLETVSKPNEALMFSIYFLAVLSLTDQDCLGHFGEGRQKLLVKYTKGLQQALINARLLKTFNLTTLQAFVLYLIGGRRLYDAHTIWILSGVAVRIAQRLGLHTSNGDSRLSPFDVEIRRRTWWQLVFLDGHASKLTGAPFPTWLAKFDTKVPANISDSELSPTMTEIPMSKEGITEMAFCAMRYQTVNMVRNAPTFQKFNEDGSPRPSTVADFIEAKDKAIDGLRQEFERNFLQYCDPSIPLQVLIMYMAKSVLITMRIMAHHPRAYPNKGASMPQSEKNMVFELCVEELENESHGHQNPLIQRYMWHAHVYFQMDAFIFMLSELRVRLSGELVERAWEQVRLAYENRPEFLTESKNTLFMAVGNFVLKAWAKREEAHFHTQLPTPAYISKLRALRSASHSKSNTESPQQIDLFGSSAPTTKPEPMFSYDHINGGLDTSHQIGLWGNPFSDADVLMPGVTSTEWEYWQSLMDGELPTFTADTVPQSWI